MSGPRLGALSNNSGDRIVSTSYHEKMQGSFADSIVDKSIG
jgi:hypothetical protein